jgi:membrane protein YdbS with pleckstrin-like domain
MKFIKRNNLNEGEDLLCTPVLHWLYIVKPLLKGLFGVMVLLVLFILLEKRLEDLLRQVGLLDARDTVPRQYIFLAAVIYILLLFVWRILLFINTEYGITSKRLIMKKGVFRITVVEIPVDRIESIICHQGILGRIFHYGTIFITGIGGTTPMFFMVCKPYRIRRMIVDITEKNKAITVIHEALKPPMPTTPAKIEEPLHRYGTFVRVLNDCGN